MNPEEYEKLDRIDREHWFYRGKRAIVRYWINHYRPLTRDDRLVDVGAGAGTWAAEMSGHCRVTAIDDHEESLRLLRPRLAHVGGEVVEGVAGALPLCDGQASVVTLLDVLEHLEDDRGAFSELVRVTRPGGLIVITVPALMMLWSDWDVVLHHYRRYTVGSLKSVVSVPGVTLLRCAYFNSLMLPIVFGVRALRKAFPAKPRASRAEDWVPAAPFNAALYQMLVQPACWKWYYPPAGVSVLAVLRRD